MAIPVMEFQKREFKMRFLPKNEFESNQCNDGKFFLLSSTSNFENVLVKNVSWIDYSPVFIICTFHLIQAFHLISKDILSNTTFLGKTLSGFVSSTFKLHNRYCHNERQHYAFASIVTHDMKDFLHNEKSTYSTFVC